MIKNSKNFERSLIPLNLQLFAKDNEDDINENDNDENDGDGKNDADEKDQNQSGKTFTQKDVTAMMAKEKNEGRKSILNALGVENVEDAQKAMKFFTKFNETFNGEKSPEEIQKILEADKSKAEQRAVDAENKLACVMAGVNKDSIEDVMAIASPKVTDDKDLSKVIEEMKTQAKYASFFSSEDSGKDKGTGKDPGHGKEKEENDSRAKKLAEGIKSNSSQKKSSYFN